VLFPGGAVGAQFYSMAKAADKTAKGQRRSKVAPMKSKKVLKLGGSSGARAPRLTKSKDSIRKALANLVTGEKVSSALANAVMKAIPLTERAGYALSRPQNAVDPRKWETIEHVKVHIDFCRRPWLPEDWCQGVKRTKGGNTYTVYQPPTEYRTLYHRWQIEDYLGRKLSTADGFTGQLKLARLAREQQPFDSEASFFKILSASERAHVIATDKFHFCIVSARRAQTTEGARDISVVQSAFEDAGATPTWYVDAASLDDYHSLGLKAKVGGKLTPARNMALDDAKRMGKVCVQCSDDLSNWEYRVGEQAKERTMDGLNAAHKISRRFCLSPVMAAKFILAKMRGAADGEKKPRLGGGYIIGDCSRTWASDEFSHRHFVLGDFLVADSTPLRFDEKLTLKEDYDFVCAHIEKYGSVVRCNRLTFTAKHYSNSGGAVDTRDDAGIKEQENMAILFEKWPNAIFPHNTRKNEVMLRWPNDGSKATEVKARHLNDAKGLQVRKTIDKQLQRARTKGIDAKAVILRTSKASNSPYISKRCIKIAGHSVEAALSTVQVANSKGKACKYSLEDLKYDIKRGFVELRMSKK